ncbi:E3 SUMO-protein ligase ZBED1-like [Temnothorax nylanderi]|uniref:E3 SUMO-protein ligase ZBED1-like n=1 Tax=Temnothorax nylanderi TaxID=102681 RepID=UPI003A87F2C9
MYITTYIVLAIAAVGAIRPIKQCEPLSEPQPNYNNYRCERGELEDKTPLNYLPPKSTLWKHFIKGSEGAACRVCPQFIKTCGNTTNLRYHLQRKHPDIYDKMVNTSESSDKPQKRKEIPSEDIAHEEEEEDDDEQLTLSPSTSSKSSVRVNSSKLCNLKQRKIKQPRLENAFFKQKSFLDGGSKASDITNKLVFMIAKDNMPLSTVEKQGFQTFMKCVSPLYIVPSRKVITSLIEEKYFYLSNLIKEELSNVDDIALTTDIWTDSHTKSYLGVTAHYHINCNKKTVMIGVTELNDRHISDNLKEWLLEIVEKWSISLQSIVVVVSDNASNIKKAIIDGFGEKKSLGCYAHTLNLVLAKIIEEDTIVSALCKKVKSIVTFFKKSVLLSDLLREHSHLTLIQSVETRWNSTFDMLERFIQLSDKIGLILLQHPTAPSMLSALELQTIKEFMELLKPFKTATTIFSGEMYVTGSQVIPIIHTLANQLESCKPTSEVGCHMKKVLTQELQARFKNIEEKSLIAIATILDPRFKKIHFLDRIACCHAINKITNILNIANKENVHKQQESNFEYQSANKNDVFWAYHETLIHKSKQYISSNTTNNEMPEEFRYYLNQVPININECPLKYWQGHPHSSLAKLAKRYLTIIATSVPSERLFSRAGNIINDLRNRLTGQHLQQLLFLNSLSIEDWHL